MNCPYCGKPDSQVIDSRTSDEGATVRRRRKCPHCDSRFTTYEKVALFFPVLVKKDGLTKVPYSQEKLRKSMELALRKRPVKSALIDEAIDKIERKLKLWKDKEISTKEVGKMVMSELRELDSVAYLRFASVYFNYSKPEDFTEALKKLGDVLETEKSK